MAQHGYMTNAQRVVNLVVRTGTKRTHYPCKKRRTRCLHGVKFMSLIDFVPSKYRTASQAYGRPLGAEAAIERKLNIRYHCSNVLIPQHPEPWELECIKKRLENSDTH